MVACTDLADGTGQGLTFLDAVTDDDRFVQHFGVFHQDDLHLRRRFQHTGFETDGRDLEESVRRDREGTQRIDKCEPTLFDIEVIVRRASFQALKLKLVRTAYDIYLENG